MSRIKIVYPVYSAHLGGSQILMLELIKHLDPERFETLVVAPMHGPLVDELRQLGRRFDILGVGGRNPVCWYRMWRLLRREKPDIMHLYGHRVFAAIASTMGIPVCETVNMGRDVSSLSRFALLDRMMSRFSDRLLPVSEFIGNQLRNHGIPDHKLSVVRPGVDIRRFVPRAADDTLRAEWGIGEKDFVVAHIGRLTEQKGLCDLIEALAKVVSKIPNIRLVVAGDGPLAGQLKALVSEHNLHNHVVFIGFFRDVERVLSLCDVFVLASHWEPLASAPLEAMACGVAVISTDVQGMPEAIHHEKDGWLVPSHSPDSIANALLMLAEDTDLRRRLGRTARERIVADFSLEKMITQMEGLYSELAGSPKP